MPLPYEVQSKHLFAALQIDNFGCWSWAEELAIAAMKPARCFSLQGRILQHLDHLFDHRGGAQLVNRGKFFGASVRSRWRQIVNVLIPSRSDALQGDYHFGLIPVTQVVEYVLRLLGSRLLHADHSLAFVTCIADSVH